MGGYPNEIAEGVIKVKVKYFLLLNFKQQQISGRSPFTVSLYLIQLLSYKGLKMSSFRSKSVHKSCRNQSKSIKLVTSCAGHVDGMKK